MSSGPAVSYDDAVMAANAAQTAKAEREKGIFNPLYYKGVPAIMKGVQCLLGLITYIIVELSDGCGTSSTLDFFKFVSMGAFVATLVLWAMLLLKVPQRCLKCDCVNWPLVEFAFYCSVIVFYFFADLFLALHACGNGQKAGAAFGYFTMFTYIIDSVMSFRAFMTSRRERQSGSSSTGGEMTDPVSEGLVSY